MHRKLIVLLLCLPIGTGATPLVNCYDKNTDRAGILDISNQEPLAPIRLSPIETLEAYYKAANDKNIKEMKRYLSKGTIKMMELGAEKMGKSLEEGLKESTQTPPTKFTNEKIKDDTATVDISAEGQTATMPFVKEDGMWKIAMDKFIEGMKAEPDEKH